MTEIKRLKLALSVLAVLGVALAIPVLEISAASMVAAKKAESAGPADVAALEGAMAAALNRRLQGRMDMNGVSLAPFMSRFIRPAIAVAVSGVLASALLALCSFSDGFYARTLGALAARSATWARYPFYELVIAVIWFALWLAAGAVASSSRFPIFNMASHCIGQMACNQVNAVVALCWLSSSNWLAIAVLLATEYGLARRRSRTIVAPDTTAILPAKAKGAASSDAPAAAAWPGPSAVPAVDPTTATV